MTAPAQRPRSSDSSSTTGQRFHTATPGVEVHRLAQHAHHFEAGVVAVGKDPRRRGAARFLAQQVAADGPIVFEIELDAELDQPADDVGAVHHHLRDEIRLAAEVTGAQRVLEVQLGTVVRAHGGLDAAFGHDRVAVAQAQLGREDHARALRGSGQRRGAPAAATADDQYVGRRQLRPGDVDVVDQRIGLQVARDLRLAGLAAVHADGERNARVRSVVRVVGLEQFGDGDVVAALRGRHARLVALARLGIGNAGRHRRAPHQRGGRAPGASKSIVISPLSICCSRRIRSPGRSACVAIMRRTNRPRWLGRMCSGQASVHRLHMTHSSNTRLAAASSPSTARLTPRWTSSPFGTGAVAAAAVTAMRGLGEDLADLVQGLPAAADVLDAIHVTDRRGEVVEEGDLHAFFDHGLAGELGLDLRRAGAAHHDATGTADTLPHAADAFDQRLSGMHEGLQDRTRGRRLDGAAFDAQAYQLHGLSLPGCGSSTTVASFTRFAK